MITAPFASEATASLAFVTGGTFGGARASLDSTKLGNPYRVPIEIRELRVMVESQTAGAGMTLRLAPFVYVDIRLGRYVMTDGDVPIALLGSSQLGHDSMDAFSLAAGGAGRTSLRRMIFPTPLYLAPGMGFNVAVSLPPSSFLPSDLALDFTALVRVAMVGAFLSPNGRKPRVNQVPMLSHVQLTQAKRRSLEDELRNPLSVPLRVHKIIQASPYRINNTLDNIIGTDTTIEIAFPDSSTLCEDPVHAGRGLFNYAHAIPVNFTMPANTRLRAQISANAAEVGPTPITGYQIGLFGTRPEVIK